MKKRLLFFALLFGTVVLTKAQFALDLPSSNDHARFSTPYFSYGTQITVEGWVNTSPGNMPWAGQSTDMVDNMATNVWLWHNGVFLRE